ncbi:MAG TPA: hypothetical protein VL946_10375, partial [Lacibacter sp.]|nr:hypothetical protein [Lacibacter sp.]
NRTFALAKTNGRSQAIIEAEKLKLTTNPFYYSLLGSLYAGIDNSLALLHYKTALQLSNSTTDRITLNKKIARLTSQPASGN